MFLTWSNAFGCFHIGKSTNLFVHAPVKPKKTSYSAKEYIETDFWIGNIINIRKLSRKSVIVPKQLKMIVLFRKLFEYDGSMLVA